MSQESIDRCEEVKAVLHRAAQEVSEELDGAPVVVVVGGSSEQGIEATLAGWSNVVSGRETRFLDIVGILQSAVLIESFLHYMEDDLFQDLKEKVGERSWWSRGRKTEEGSE